MLTRSQIAKESVDARVDFCLDKQPTYEVALARRIESAACAERDARIAELERLRSEDHSHALDLAAEIERLTQQLEEARKDAELLDYIQTNGATVEIIPGAPDFYPVHFRVGGRYRTANENIRDAISAAIKEQT